MYPALLVFLAALIWSTSGLLIRWIGLSPMVLSFYRTAVPTAVVIAWYLARGYRPRRDTIGIKMGASAINAVRFFAFFFAYAHTTIANAVVALYTWPIFAAVLGRFLLHERVSRRQIILLLVAFCGVPLLYMGGSADSGEFTRSSHISGISVMLMAAFLHALTVVLLKRANTGGDRFEAVLFQNLVGAVVFLPAVLLTTETVHASRIALAVVFGLVIGVGSYTLFFAGLYRMPAARASNIAYFEVIGAVILAWIFVGEVPAWSTIAGGALITLSVLLAGTGPGAGPDAQADSRGSAKNPVPATPQ